MSDETKDEFTPIDMTSLDNFEGEQISGASGADPDFDRFKLLFDPGELTSDPSAVFKALYTPEKEKKDQGFAPLIQPKKNDPLQDSRPVEPESAEENSGPDSDPGPTPGEQARMEGYEAGFEQGLAKGMEEGREKGYKEGFEQGRTEGLEQGRAEGLEQGEKQGYEKGVEQGTQQAVSTVQTEAKQILEPLKEALETMDTLVERLVDQYETQILELIARICRKAVGARIDTDDEVVRHTILEALKHLVAPEEITLNVSSEDYEYIEMIKDEFFEAVSSLKHVAVKSDPGIRKGGCQIETATASIATDPESKLSAIYDALIQVNRS